MSRAHSQFQKNLQRISDLSATHQSLRALVGPAADLSDILRYQIVQIASALDAYVHAILLEKVLDVLAGTRPATPYYRSFTLPLGVLHDESSTAAATVSMVRLEEAIRDSLGWRSFQRAGKIKEAMNLIYTGDIWVDVAAELSVDVRDAKNRLDLIVARRDQIAHEADIDPTYGTLFPIDPAMTRDAVEYVTRVVAAIERFVS